MPLPLTISCSSKIHIGLTFLVPAHLGSPGQRAIKWVRVFVCDTSSFATRPPVCISLPFSFASEYREKIHSNWFPMLNWIHSHCQIKVTIFDLVLSVISCRLLGNTDSKPSLCAISNQFFISFSLSKFLAFACTWPVPFKCDADYNIRFTKQLQPTPNCDFTTFKTDINSVTVYWLSCSESHWIISGIKTKSFFGKNHHYFWAVEGSAQHSVRKYSSIGGSVLKPH